MVNALDVLQERGFVEQVSDAEGLRSAMESPLTFYIGYDPSAASLHAGSLPWRTCSDWGTGPLSWSAAEPA